MVNEKYKAMRCKVGELDEALNKFQTLNPQYQLDYITSPGEGIFYAVWRRI